MPPRSPAPRPGAPVPGAPHRTGPVAAFGFAWAGLVAAARRERNLRVHLALGVLASAFAAVAPLPPTGRALLLGCVAAVIALEALNSAVEAAVDRSGLGRDDLARHAKDAAAGAVLVAAAGAVLVFLEVAAPTWGALRSRAGQLALPAAGALGAAVAAAVLPAPFARPRGVDAALAVGGVAGLAAVVPAAGSRLPLAAAALLLAVACDAARRARSGR